jgi:hypothetical protein
MIRIPNPFTHLRKSILVSGLILAPVWFSGCVDINDTRVQVQHPEEVDPYARNVLDKCPQHTNPHRLITALTGATSPLGQSGPQLVSNQVDFDRMWDYLSSVDMGNVTTSSLSQKPVIDWGQDMAYFLVVPLDSSCQKTKPFGDEMNTDCYSITIPLYRYLEGTNCGPPLYYPVFIYIYSNKSLPMNVQWNYPTPTVTLSPVPTAKPTATATPTPTATPESEDD